jgi:NADPH-dependent 2,4-dienoyl-CoA reductase/sulfur reductase-like enzyme
MWNGESFINNALEQIMNILIIGGVAGGASAATRARRVNPEANITILEKGPAISFANCGLPYHLGGEIKKREKLLVATPELFKNRFGIDVYTDTEALKIDRTNKTVATFRRTDNASLSFRYDKLIISTGLR